MSTKPQDLMMTLMLAKESGVMDDETKEMVRFMLSQQVAEIKALKQAREADGRNSIELAKKFEAKKSYLRANCPHTAGSRGTRCRGQWLPNKQLFLVCSRCFTEFHNPPDVSKGQHAAPQHLIPPEGSIGGPLGSMSMS